MKASLPPFARADATYPLTADVQCRATFSLVLPALSDALLSTLAPYFVSCLLSWAWGVGTNALMETWGAHDAEHEADAAKVHASEEDGDRADGGLGGNRDDDHMRDDGSGSDGGGNQLGTKGNKPANDSASRESKGGGGNGRGAKCEEEDEKEGGRGEGVRRGRSGVVASKGESKGTRRSADEDGRGSDGNGGEPKRSRQHDTDAQFGERTEDYVETDHVEDSDNAPSEEGDDSPIADGNSGGGAGTGGDHDAGVGSGEDGGDCCAPRPNSNAFGSSDGHGNGVCQKADAHETHQQFEELENENVYDVDRTDSDMDPFSANEEAEQGSVAAEEGDGHGREGSEHGGGGVCNGGVSDGDRSVHFDGAGGCTGGSGGTGSGGGGSCDSDGDLSDRGGGSVGGGGESPRTDSSGAGRVREAPRLQEEARMEHRRRKRESRWFALWRRLYRRRWLRQYVENGMLAREGRTRVIGTDELFMDLIGTRSPVWCLGVGVGRVMSLGCASELPDEMVGGGGLMPVTRSVPWWLRTAAQEAPLSISGGQYSRTHWFMPFYFCVRVAFVCPSRVCGGFHLPLHPCIGVVVSCTSAVGQVLRKSPDPGYRDVEKFSLLFASVWGIWRDAGTLGGRRSGGGGADGSPSKETCG